MQVFALIPARSGSKGVPGKNLREIEQKSLIHISINSAKQCTLINTVTVSSDSNEILQISKNLGAVALLRPPIYSSDTATANDVVRHFITSLSGNYDTDDIIVYLQPTSPFRNKNLIHECISNYLSTDVPTITVSEVVQHPSRMLSITSSGSLIAYSSDVDLGSNRQDLSRVVIPSGSVYVFSIADFKKEDKFPILGASPVLVSNAEAIDIDTEIDLELARAVGRDYEF